MTASRSSCARPSTTRAEKSPSCSARRSIAARSIRNCPRTTRSGCSRSCGTTATCRRTCVYEGSTRAGYKTLPGPAEQAGVRRDPVPLERAARRRHVERDAVRGELHPAGHHVPAGRRHGPHRDGVRATSSARSSASRSEVTAIRRTDTGASVAFVDKRTGKRDAIDATYCIVTIPLTGPARRSSAILPPPTAPR